MIRCLRTLIAFLFVALVFSANTPRKPNVVLIMTDDQGWGDLSLHGNPWLRTPHLDGLARSGVQLTQFYVSPLCAPTRASLLTGRYHLRTGVVSVSKGLETMDTDETTLAELFRANGYRTGIFGKWHNGQHAPNRPTDQGFDEFFGFCAGHWSNYFDTTLDRNGKAVKTKGFITDVLTDAALAFMGAARDKPFFCYIPYNAPHSPHQVPDAYFEPYKALGLDNELASVYGMVANVDANVGRILQFLKKQQLDENTIVVFLTDNGPNGVRYNGSMRGIKGSVHEGGVRVPFFIRWTGRIPAGKQLHTPLAHIDLYPTLTELCGLRPQPGKPLDGRSFASMLNPDPPTPAPADRMLFTHVNQMTLPLSLNSGGFRTNRYRFVFERDRVQLYDLLADPAEKNDLTPSQGALLDSFRTTYRNWVGALAPAIPTDRPTLLLGRTTELPVYEATLTEGLQFKEGHGWAHDWLGGWSSTQDSLYWPIDCRKPGRYRLELDYLCAPADVGSRIQCRVANQNRSAVVSPAFTAPLLPSPDRVPRKEAYEMSRWGQLSLGTFAIPAGRQTITLKATAVSRNKVAEVRLLRLVAVP